MCILAEEDWDQGRADGYGCYRLYTIVGSMGYHQIDYVSYRSGGSDQASVAVQNPDPEQWFFVMLEYQAKNEVGYSLNGKYISSIFYSNQDGPHPTSVNKHNGSYLNSTFGRRRAGAWDNNQTYNGGVYNYFLISVNDFTTNSEFLSMGVDPMDRDTWYKPFAKIDGDIIVPITDEEYPNLGANIASTSRGLYIHVLQWKNDIEALYKESIPSYTNLNIRRGEDTDYTVQPIYGYTL